MAYNTDSTKSPAENTGDITPGLVQRVPNNPFHANAEVINYPTKYDSLVTKTNDQMVSISVTDEDHNSGEIDTSSSNALYLHHRPRLGTSITHPGETVAVVDTGLTDFNNGIIYFSTLPTGDVITMQYLADPDKYYGESINVLQDTTHQIELLLGAGGAINEGVKNAELWADSVSSALTSRMPNLVHVRDLDRDIILASDAADLVGNTIRIGNVADRVVFGDDTGSFSQSFGILHCSVTGESRTIGMTDDTVTANDTGLQDVLKCYGDVTIFGNLKIVGTQLTLQTTNTSQLAIITDDFQVNADTYLGNDSADQVYVRGDMTITGGLTIYGVGNKNLTVGRNIVMSNLGTNSGTVDGLDCSYIAKVQDYLRPAGSDWKGDCVNFGRMGTTFDTGNIANAGYSGSATSTAAVADLIVDSAFVTTMTGIPSEDNGFYYEGRFDDGTWFVRITDSDSTEQGNIIRVDSVDTGTDTIILSRALDTPTASGTTYKFFNPYFVDMDLVSPSGTTLTVNGSGTEPLVANNNGQIKVGIASVALAGASVDGMYFVYMNQDGVNREAAPQYHFNTGSGAPSDESILMGQVNRLTTFSDMINYRPNLKFDSTWRLVGATTDYRYPGSSTAIIPHNIGGDFRIRDLRFTLLTAPTVSGGPNLALVAVTTPTITLLTRTKLTLATPGSGWFRLMVTV